MTTHTMSPAELEAELQARLAAARAPQARRAKSGRRTSAPRTRNPSEAGAIRPKAAGLVVAVATLLIAVGTALATTYIDLTIASATGTTTDGVNGAVGDGVFIQGGLGSGTGNFNPFMTMNTQGSKNVEAGVNSCVDNPNAVGCSGNTYDTFYGGSRTKAIQVAGIPQVEYNGELYREFTLDASDEGGDDFMSLDQLKIFIDDQADLHEYVFATETFADNTGITPVKVYDMGDTRVLMRTQGLTPGNGVSDITLLVKDDAFPANCFYGSTTCNRWLYFWNSNGAVGTSLDDDRDYNVTAGFEEWRVSLQPVVNVSKDATPSFDRTFDWTIDKTVDPEALNLFNGDTGTVTWSVTPTRGAAQDSNWQVTGTITVTNPTGDEDGPIPQNIDATVNSVEDLIDGTIDVGADGTLTCPDFPVTLDPGESLECTYSYTYSSDPGAGEHTNTATANIDITDTDTTDYSGSATFDFADATPTVTDDTATVTDDRGPLNQAAVSGQAITYPEDFTCDEDEGPHVNTARVTEDDTSEFAEDDATVTVTCYELTVSKTAVPSFDREFDWTITKTVSDEAIDLFNGDDQEVTWTITWDRDNGTDSNWAVAGVITVNNPAPMAATNVSVADALAGPIAAEVDCDPAVGDQNDTTIDSIAAGGSATCDYWATLPNATTRLNTATATLFGEDYTGTQSVNFTGVAPNEIDESASITDDRGNSGSGLDLDVTGDGSTNYNETFACGDDAGSHANTAVVTEDESDPVESDSATATTVVTCYGLSVSKTATTEFTRDYDWDVQKSRVILEGEELPPSDGLPETLILDEGQTYVANYEIVVTMTGYTDSGWFVSGVITISNDTPLDATGVSVSDVISPDTPTVEIDCDPAVGDQNDSTVDILAGGTATCDYWAELTDASARTNVATATLNEVDYDSASVDVTFDDTPDVEIDECVDIDDNNGTPADETDDDEFQVCLDDLEADGTFTASYTIEIGPYEVCGEFSFVNHVDLTTSDDDNDTDESDSDEYTVGVTVPCPEGCTLTQGYWKTHNESFWGGAPVDETWELIGPLAENEIFFLSGQTYFDVMWTAPQGNVYYNLAHQYIAAELNMLDGADPTDAQAAFDDATDLFNTYTPAQVAELKGKNGKELRAEFIELAGILGDYNEGEIGPGHCDEEPEGAFTGVTTVTATPMVIDRRVPLMA